MKGWIIPPPPLHSGDFVAHLERVLDIYKRANNAAHPVVCMDESSKQMVKETWQVMEMAPAREDYEYGR